MLLWREQSGYRYYNNFYSGYDVWNYANAFNYFFGGASNILLIAITLLLATAIFTVVIVCLSLFLLKAKSKIRKLITPCVIIQYALIFVYFVFGIINMIIIEGATNTYIPFLLGTLILAAYFFVPRLIASIRNTTGQSNKKFVITVASFLSVLLILNMVLPVAISHQDRQMKKDLTKTSYTYETLAEDWLKYYDTYLLAENFRKQEYIKENASVPDLLNYELIKVMEEKEAGKFVIFELFNIFYLHYNKYAVYDESNGMYIPLAVINLYLQRDMFKPGVECCIREQLLDPNSLIIEGSQDFYASYNPLNKKQYVSNDGMFTGEIYVFVEYQAKNMFGGYVRGTRWLRWQGGGVFAWTLYEDKNDLKWSSTNQEIKKFDFLSWDY
ncbi:MAG: hypothetical protein FWE84_02195 [Firmicutes bacterium]|nr:hypothetical protein [Bacillota bacterium]